MKFTASIDIMPRSELLDPQGKTVESNLPNIGIQGIHEVRIGKRITLFLDAVDKKEAEKKLTDACDKLLVNRIMEEYEYEINEV